MKQFIEQIENHRKYAIYNYTYKYIKDIIWDDEKNSKYGNDRKGYETFTEENDISVSFAGIDSLRTVYDMNNNIQSYIIETKEEINHPLLEIIDIFNKAIDEFCKIVGSVDSETLRWWLDKELDTSPRDVNSYMYAVKQLDRMVDDYDNYDDFRQFIDKIK